jgi:hypothetical protein
MATKMYSEKIKNPKWQKKRLEVLNKANFTCELCHDTEETLQVHHLQYLNGKEPWEYPLDNFKCLCATCHEAISIINWIDYKDIIKVLKVKSLGCNHNNVYIKYYNKDYDSIWVFGIAVNKSLDYPLLVHLSLKFLNTLNNEFDGL